jgi:hypothetical protein
VSSLNAKWWDSIMRGLPLSLLFLGNRKKIKIERERERKMKKK